MKGHPELDRAVFPAFISPVLQARLYHVLYSFQPSSPQEQSRNKPNLEETREACPHLWNPLKGCHWKRIQKQVEGFCVPFSGSVGRSLWVRSGETWVLIYAQKPFMSCHQQEDLASSTLVMTLNSEVLWKDPKLPELGLWLSPICCFSFVFLPPPRFSSPVFLLCCPQQPQQLVRGGGNRPGYLRVNERFTGLATQRNRLLWKSDSSPPQRLLTSPFLRDLFLLVLGNPGTWTPLLHLWRHLFTNSAL